MEPLSETLNPTAQGQQDDFTEWMRSKDAAFVGAKRLSDGTYVGLKRLLFTHAICMGVTREASYTRRYCYEDLVTCLDEYRGLVSIDDVPVGWIAQRPPVLDE